MSNDAEKLVEEFSEDLAMILETFIEETQDAKVVIARIETEVGRLKEDITSLNKTIRDGNVRREDCRSQGKDRNSGSRNSRRKETSLGISLGRRAGYFGPFDGTLTLLWVLVLSQSRRP